MTPERFARGRAMCMVGLRRRHPFEGIPERLAQQWADFLPQIPLPRQVDGVCYGVICGADAEGMEYMAAVEMPDFSVVPEGVGRLRVPEQEYAVFVHDGHVIGLHAVWIAILHQWLPTADYVSANTPDFERYDERFDAATGTGVIEIWFPVVPRG